MKPLEAYNRIKLILDGLPDISIGYSKYEEKFFGNFVIDYHHVSAERSIVCDRGQLLLCRKPHGEGECQLVIEDIYAVDDIELENILRRVKDG